MQFLIGIPAVALSAIAGAAAFSRITNNAIIAGCFSLAAAVVTAVYTFLNPLSKGDAYHAPATSFQALYEDAAYFVRTESTQPGVNYIEILNKLNLLHDKLSNLLKSRPSVGGYAYRHAERVLSDKIKGRFA
jgi:hypothetical protein